MDADTDQFEELQRPPLEDDPEIEMPPFPNMQNLQPMVVEEVPLEDLVNFDDLAPQQPLPEPPTHFENVQLGFVETFAPPVDPGLFLPKASLGPSPDAIRLWAKFFSTVDQSLPTVTIPTAWMNFFTLLIMKQSSFEWAKEFLQSSGWTAILNSSSSQGTSFTFTIPRQRPNVSITEFTCSVHSTIVCTEPGLPDDVDSEPPLLDFVGLSTTESVAPTLLDAALLQEPEEPLVKTPPPSSTNKPVPRAKRGKSLHIFEAELRRSNRIHGITKCFKSPTCKDRDCLGCTSNPPLLSASVVRELGSSFCKVSPDQLSNEKLEAKTTKKGAVAKPRSKRPKKSKETEEKPTDEAVSESQAKPAKKPKGSKNASDEGASSKNSKK